MMTHGPRNKRNNITLRQEGKRCDDGVGGAVSCAACWRTSSVQKKRCLRRRGRRLVGVVGFGEGLFDRREVEGALFFEGRRGGAGEVGEEAVEEVGGADGHGVEVLADAALEGLGVVEDELGVGELEFGGDGPVELVDRGQHGIEAGVRAEDRFFRGPAALVAFESAQRRAQRRDGRVLRLAAEGRVAERRREGLGEARRSRGAHCLRFGERQEPHGHQELDGRRSLLEERRPLLRRFCRGELEGGGDEGSRGGAAAERRCEDAIRRNVDENFARHTQRRGNVLLGREPPRVHAQAPRQPLRHADVLVVFSRDGQRLLLFLSFVDENEVQGGQDFVAVQKRRALQKSAGGGVGDEGPRVQKSGAMQKGQHRAVLVQASRGRDVGKRL
mmetsp:Transcript_20188/g.62421  ORF Transcript_20188/g.62421 Transcript_20188/m.62421 type:complete len:387 (-) Transcript_20188:610-1770(-)